MDVPTPNPKPLFTGKNDQSREKIRRADADMVLVRADDTPPVYVAKKISRLEAIAAWAFVFGSKESQPCEH